MSHRRKLRNQWRRLHRNPALGFGDDSGRGGLSALTSGKSGGVFVIVSSIAGNTVPGSSRGGGVSTGTTFAASDVPTIRESTTSDNTQVSVGGGIYNRAGVSDLVNSTVSVNSAEAGGGVFNDGGTTALRLSTVAGNSAMVSAGGVYNPKATDVHNSIIAGNEAAGSASSATAGCEAVSPIVFGGYGLFGDGTGCPSDGRMDQKLDPASIWGSLLRPLADNIMTSTWYAICWCHKCRLRCEMPVWQILGNVV